MKLIVNADDFGMDENTSKAICDAFKLGLINRTTLMVNMPWADQAVMAARENGFFDAVGLHINLTNGKPLTESIRGNSRFCNEDGIFDKRFGRDRRQLLPYSSRDAQDIVAEVRAQAQRYRQYGFPLFHCDSHHHLHFALSLLSLILPVVSEVGFKTIRRPYNIGFQGLKGRAKRLRAWLFEKKAQRYGLTCGDLFSGCEGFILGYERSMRMRDIELMVHPYYREGLLIDIVKGDLKVGPSLVQTMNRVRERYEA